MKLASINDFLTPEEIDRAIKMYENRSQSYRFHVRCRDEIIKPVMDRINKSLGQENSPDYLAYAVEAVLSAAERR